MSRTGCHRGDCEFVPPYEGGSSQIYLGHLDTLRDKTPRFQGRPAKRERPGRSPPQEEGTPRSHAPRGNAVFDALRRGLGSRGDAGNADATTPDLPGSLVPTLRMGMPSSTLCVVFFPGSCCVSVPSVQDGIPARGKCQLGNGVIGLVWDDPPPFVRGKVLKPCPQQSLRRIPRDCPLTRAATTTTLGSIDGSCSDFSRRGPESLRLVNQSS